MYNNVDGIPMEKLAVDNGGYHEPVDEPDNYLSPAGDRDMSPAQLKHEEAMGGAQKQNGKPGIRPKNSRFDSGMLKF